MTVGERVIDRIIAGTLCTAKCAHDDEHGCIIVWSSGAAEQIEAIAQQGAVGSSEMVRVLAEKFEREIKRTKTFKHASDVEKRVAVSTLEWCLANLRAEANKAL